VNTLIEHATVDLLPEPPDLEASRDEDIRTQVWGILARLYCRNGQVERRREQRYPFPGLIRLTPAAESAAPPDGESLVVVGKHISERGLGFYHARPIPYRRMIASVEAGGGRWLGFLVDLSWCRFTEHGWYESGGRFLESVLSPVGESQHP
jgi:hypothetical protein